MNFGNPFGYNNRRIHSYTLYVEKIIENNLLHAINKDDMKYN